jgi:arsenite methyltransferase
MPAALPLHFLSFEPDFASPKLVEAYDEVALWSAMFGLLLLDEVPLRGVTHALDVGCGTGFPLIELAERLGPAAEVHGLDPWSGGLGRAAAKIAVRETPNVTLHEGSASEMPFAASSFDLIVSNLGLNNFDDRAAAVRECRRVARPGATLALTTNLRGHMRELYDVFDEVLRDVLPEDAAALERLRAHVEHRATVAGIRDLLESGGFEVVRVVEREGTMRFANGTALFNHYFIRLGFLDAWKQVVPANEPAVFTELLRRLDAAGELRLTIPMAYVEAKLSALAGSGQGSVVSGQGNPARARVPPEAKVSDGSSQLAGEPGESDGPPLTRAI